MSQETPVSKAPLPIILIVDDSEFDCQFLALACGSLKCEIITAHSGKEALDLFHHHRVDLVISDYLMEPMDGMALIQEMRLIDPSVECIFVTGSDSPRAMAYLQSSGLGPVMTKPVGPRNLLNRVVAGIERMSDTYRRDPVSISNTMDRCLPLLGPSEAAGVLRRSVVALSESSVPLLIDGEKGAGKRSVARVIHGLGPMRDGPLVEVHGEGMAEDEVRAALLDEDGRLGGTVRAAHGGTLLLDGLESLPQGMQRAFANHYEKVTEKCRLIVVLDGDVDDMLERGDLDERLYFKVSLNHLGLPSLAERCEDAPAMLDFIASRHASYGLPVKPSREISREFQESIARWEGTGNLSGLIALFREFLVRASSRADEAVCVG